MGSLTRLVSQLSCKRISKVGGVAVFLMQMEQVSGTEQALNQLGPPWGNGSGKGKHFGNEGNNTFSLLTQGTQFGQWDTAGFENEEQKLKFLKLMGGFKKLSPSFGRTPDKTRRPNMALDRMAASSLQQSLQQDYARALTWKHGGRAGLGFAASNKVFCIDRNASRSIKFED